MKFLRHKKMVGLIAIFLAGCLGSDESNLNKLESDEALAQQALESPFDIFGTGDEAYQFGDPEFDELASEVDYSDPYNDLSASTSSLTNSLHPEAVSCDIYFMRLRWGQFREAHSDVSSDVELAPTDWSGSLSANVGELVLLRTIAFEAEDSILDRTDPKVIEFVSKTKPHFDGLRVKYRVCESDKLALSEDAIPTITFDAPLAPLNKSYTSSDLAHINDVVEVENANQDKFQLQSILKTDLCQGTLEGRWKNVRDGRGVLKGKVIASNGVRVGFVKGVFGKNEEGENIWAAKFISRRHGGFKGILRGTYGEGNFEGIIFLRKRDPIGNVSGSYEAATEDGKYGTFSGIYTLNCAEHDRHADEDRDKSKESDQK